MTMLFLLELGLVALVLALAWWVIAARDAFAAVVGFVALGLLLALVWVRLDAVDVALAEAAIGGGLTGVLLIRAAARLRPTEAAAPPAGAWLRAAAAVGSAAVAAGVAAAVLSLPEPAPTLAPQAAANLPATDLGNPVTATLMAFRPSDTLLEKIVLLLALVGVWSLAPDRAWGGRPGARPRAEPRGPLALLARLLVPVGAVAGVYLLWVSADEPGGAFQGGTILAAMWLLAIMAGQTDAPPLQRAWLRAALVAGPTVFIAAGTGGVPLAGAFLALPEGWAKPIILTVELAMLGTVAVTLAMLLCGPPRRVERP